MNCVFWDLCGCGCDDGIYEWFGVVCIDVCCWVD